MVPNARFCIQMITIYLVFFLSFCYRVVDLSSFDMTFAFVCRFGFFFAVKEVSLLDQGSQAKQSIIQLEHVIHNY